MDDNMLSAIVGGVIGTLGTLLCGCVAYLLEKRRLARLAAIVLYNDMLSIERYLKYGSGSVNIRYSENWQQMVSYCTFLTAYEVEFIYNIYDIVYDYNYDYKSKEKNGKFGKEDIQSYKMLQNAMFDLSKGKIDIYKDSVSYRKLKENLKKHIK